MLWSELFNYTGSPVCFEMALCQGLQGQLMSRAGSASAAAISGAVEVNKLDQNAGLPAREPDR